MNLKALRNGKLDDGKTVGGRGSLAENKIEQIQRYYGLAIQQNALQKPIFEILRRGYQGRL